MNLRKMMRPTTLMTGLCSRKTQRKAEFPKLFAKIGGKRGKGREIPTTLSGYMKIIGFGLNAPKANGKDEDKPSHGQRSQSGELMVSFKVFQR